MDRAPNASSPTKAEDESLPRTRTKTWFPCTAEERESLRPDSKVLQNTVQKARERVDAVWQELFEEKYHKRIEEEDSTQSFWFYVSSSEKDQEAGAWLTAELRMREVPTFHKLDEKRLYYGKDGLRRTVELLSQSKHILILYTRNAHKSVRMWVEIEVARRLRKSIHVLVDRVESIRSLMPQGFDSVGHFIIPVQELQCTYDADYSCVTKNEIIFFQRRKPLREGMITMLLDSTMFGPQFEFRKAQGIMKRKLWSTCSELVEEMRGCPSIHDTFLSHCQLESQDAVATLAMAMLAKLKELKKEIESGAHVAASAALHPDTKICGSLWYDQTAELIDTPSMVRGVAQSRTFILYATKTYFARPFCWLELQVAIELKKNIIVVWESDTRHYGFRFFGEFAKIVPRDVRDAVLRGEAETMHRRRFLREASINRIVRKVLHPVAFHSGTTGMKSHYIGDKSPRGSEGA